MWGALAMTGGPGLAMTGRAVKVIAGGGLPFDGLRTPLSTGFGYRIRRIASILTGSKNKD